MPVGLHTDPNIKARVLSSVRDEGMSAQAAASQYNVNVKTVYRWLKENVVNTSTSLILENNRLKKELEQAYNLLGRATAELKHPKR